MYHKFLKIARKQSSNQHQARRNHPQTCCEYSKYTFRRTPSLEARLLWDVHQQGHQPRTFILQFLNFELSPWWQNVTKSCSSLILQSKSELLQITFTQFVKRIIKVIAWKSSDVSKQIKKCQSQQINLDRRDAGHKTCNIIPVGISVCYIVPICGHNWYKNMSCYYWYLRCGVLDG